MFHHKINLDEAKKHAKWMMEKHCRTFSTVILACLCVVVAYRLPFGVRNAHLFACKHLLTFNNHYSSKNWHIDDPVNLLHFTQLSYACWWLCTWNNDT